MGSKYNNNKIPCTWAHPVFQKRGRGHNRYRMCMATKGTKFDNFAQKQPENFKSPHTPEKGFILELTLNIQLENRIHVNLNHKRVERDSSVIDVGRMSNMQIR